MRIGLLSLGIILVLVSHGLHHHTLRQLQQATTVRPTHSRTVYHGFLYLGLLYVAISLWRPNWVDARVIGLLVFVDILAMTVSYFQHRHRTYPAATRVLWQRQAWYLVGSQLILAAVLLGTLVNLPA